MDQAKKCGTCKELKPLIEFHKDKAAKDGLQAHCKSCAVIKRRGWLKETGWKQSPRPTYKRHHLTQARYEEMKQAQAGLCSACRTDPAVVIDHDHACCPATFSCGNCIRGLLCRQCNAALGQLKEDEKRILGLVEYLRRFQAD